MRYKLHSPDEGKALKMKAVPDPHTQSQGEQQQRADRVEYSGVESMALRQGTPQDYN
jgi:hypothetical protein